MAEGTPRLLTNGLGSELARGPALLFSQPPCRPSASISRDSSPGPASRVPGATRSLPTTPPPADLSWALTNPHCVTPPLQPSEANPSPSPLTLPSSLDIRTPEAALTVSDVAPHLILGHDQVLGDSLLLLLVLARHLPTATTTAAASFLLSRRLCRPSQPQAVNRTPSIREETASKSASKLGNGRAGESEKLRTRGLRRRARWDNESLLLPAPSRPRGLPNYNPQHAFRAPKPGPGALPSEGLARWNRRARWEGSGSGGKAEPLESTRGSVVSPGKTIFTRNAER